MKEIELINTCKEAERLINIASEQCASLTEKINNLIRYTQEPNFIMFNNFNTFQEECIEIEDIIKSLRNKLNYIYQFTYYVYNGGEECEM